MNRIRTSRRRYCLTRHPLLDRAQRWLAVLIPFGVAVYVALRTWFDFITPIGALFSPGANIIITGDYSTAIRVLDRHHIDHRWGQETPDGGVIIRVDDEQEALKVLRREGISAY